MSGEKLWNAAQDGRLEEVQRLLATGLQPDGYRYSGGWTALHEASAKGHSAIVGALLSAGASVRAVAVDGRTPLHWAALWGHLPVTRALLAAGAQPQAQDKNGNTTLHWAARGGHQDIVRLLLEHTGGVQCLSIKNNAHRTPREEAQHNKKTAIVSLLTELESRAQAAHTGMCTYLHDCTSHGMLILYSKHTY